MTTQLDGSPQLDGSHRRTYDAVFQHPVARDLAWRDVCSMLGALAGVVQEEREGTLKVTRNGRMVVLHRPLRKNITNVQELMDLRRFLEQSETPVPRRQTDAAREPLPGIH